MFVVAITHKHNGPSRVTSRNLSTLFTFMLVLRKPLFRPLLQIVRFNATVAQLPQVPPPSNEGAKTHGRRRRKIPPKRPDISLDNPRKWNRPLGEGVIPAYDLALHVLRRDSKNLKAELKILRAQIAEKEKAYKALEERADALPPGADIRDELERLDEELEELMKKADIVEVQGEVNLPSVRWTLNNAMGMLKLLPFNLTYHLYQVDMSKVSHRHLVAQKWRKDGDLDLLVSIG